MFTGASCASAAPLSGQEQRRDRRRDERSGSYVRHPADRRSRPSSCVSHSHSLRPSRCAREIATRCFQVGRSVQRRLSGAPGSMPEQSVVRESFRRSLNGHRPSEVPGPVERRVLERFVERPCHSDERWPVRFDRTKSVAGSVSRAGCDPEHTALAEQQIRHRDERRCTVAPRSCWRDLSPPPRPAPPRCPRPPERVSEKLDGASSASLDARPRRSPERELRPLNLPPPLAVSPAPLCAPFRCRSHPHYELGTFRLKTRCRL